MEPIDIKIDNFREYLDSHVITFQYTKKDGSVRTAKGTTNSKYVSYMCPFNLERDSIRFEKEPIDKLVELRYNDVDDYATSNGLTRLFHIDDEKYYYFVPQKREKKYNPDVINYFDIEKKDWRSFKEDNYIGVMMMGKIKEDEIQDI